MSEKIETRGRKSLPLDKKKAPQATVKVNDFILPFVKELKGNLKKGMVTDKTLFGLFSALNGTEQQGSIFNDPNTVSIVTELQEKILRVEAEKQIIEAKLIERESLSLKLVLERDKEHLNVVHTESRLDSLASSYRLLKNDYAALLHREHDCMSIKADGQRCTKKSVIDSIYHGINIHVCLQHAKVLAKTTNNKKVT